MLKDVLHKTTNHWTHKGNTLMHGLKNHFKYQQYQENCQVIIQGHLYFTVTQVCAIGLDAGQ